MRAGPLELFVRPSPADRPRVAFVVPLHGRRVVDRNRLRRRLRELIRRGWLARAHRRGPAVDLVVRARPEAYDASREELREALCGKLESEEWPGESS